MHVFNQTDPAGTITLVSAAVDGDIEVSNLLLSILNMNRATLRSWSCGGFELDERITFSVHTGKWAHRT